MKSLNTLVLASVIALAGAGFASAQSTSATIYHVTGSTAYRVADVTAEVDYLASTGTTVAVYPVGGSLTGSSSSIVVGPGTSPIVFENLFNGSIAGDEAVAAVGTPLSFPSYKAYTGTYGGVNTGSSSAGATGGAPASSSLGTDSAFAEISFSDVSGATAQNIINLVPGVGSYSFTDYGTTLGVVPFVFVANATTDVTDFGSTSTFTSTASGTFTYATATVAANVTPQSFARLWSSGVLNTAKKHPEIFTGNASDSTYSIYALGRDIDSGTRATALAETGYPIKGNGAKAVTNTVVQYFPEDSSGAVVGTSSQNATTQLVQVPTQTVDGIVLTNGNGGYGSGGNLAKALSDPFSGLSKTVEISYLGASDAYSALTGVDGQPALLLSYNGVSFNPAGSSATKGFATPADLTKVYDGIYTFWSYEHLLFNTQTINGAAGPDPTSISASLATQLINDGVDQVAAAGVHVGTGGMLVTRTDDGLLVQ